MLTSVAWQQGNLAARVSSIPRKRRPTYVLGLRRETEPKGVLRNRQVQDDRKVFPYPPGWGGGGRGSGGLEGAGGGGGAESWRERGAGGVGRPPEANILRRMHA